MMIWPFSIIKRLSRELMTARLEVLAGMERELALLKKYNALMEKHENLVCASMAHLGVYDSLRAIEQAVSDLASKDSAT